MTEKTCSTCRQTKPISEFYKGGPMYRDGYKGQCKTCFGAKAREYARAHPEVAREAQRRYETKRKADPVKVAKRNADRARRYREKHGEPKKPGPKRNYDNPYDQKTVEGRRAYNRKVNYGLEAGQFEAMLEAQGNACKICGRTDPGRAWHVDHDHATGAVRGILCVTCNVGIGGLHDSPDILLAALAYLKDASTEGASAA